MKASKIIWTFCALFVGLSAAAQSGQAFVEEAMASYRDGKIEESRQAIEKALEFEEMGSNAYAWHFKGFIYKELFKEEEQGSSREEMRELAVMAVERSMELDIPEQYLEANIKALAYMAITFQRDSYELSTGKTEGDLLSARKKFTRFKALFEEVYPDSSLAQIQTDFFNTIGRSYINQADQKNGEASDQLRKKALSAYALAIENDSNNYVATINSGITIYNMAVAKIKAIDHRTEIFELIVVQDECVALFREALPFFKKAYKLEPKKSLPLQALVACHKSLNDAETATRFEDIQAELINAGKLEE